VIRVVHPSEAARAPRPSVIAPCSG
jgi:hypothetical protein